MEDRSLKRTISLWGAIAIIIGYVVGASIFILPGKLAYTAGPGLFISFLVASVFAMFVCIIGAQVGSALPISGANYVIVSRTISPFAGFMYFWTTMVTISVGVPVIAYGFANYLSFFLPGINPMLSAVLIILFCMIINIIGVNIASSIQAFLVVEFIIVLLIFGIGGLIDMDRSNFVPLFPNGIPIVLLTAIPAGFSFTGFNIITALGDEIKDPSRNIPLSILISFLSVVFIYMIVTIAVPGLLPWQTLSGVEAPIAVASGKFLPGWFANIIALSALAAALTSVNGVLMGQARDCFAIAKDNILPAHFALISKKFKSPHVAILFVTSLTIIGVLFGTTIEDYAVLTVIGFTILKCLLSVATIRLPKKLPEHYAQAPFKLGNFQRIFSASALIVIAILFMLAGSSHNIMSTMIFFIFLFVGCVYYKLRKHMLLKKNIQLDEFLKKSLNHQSTR